MRRLVCLCLAGLFASIPVFAQLPSDTQQRIRDANGRIEKIRKGDVELFISTHDGEPIPYTDIHIEQIKSDFLFGCAAITVAKHSSEAAEAKYQQLFAKLFNFATILTYWPDTSPTPDTDKLDLLTAQVNALRAKDITVKGHPLFLAGSAPLWAGQDPDLARKKTLERIDKLTKLYAGKITVWDVVGDSTTATNAKNGLGAWARKSGAVKLTGDCMLEARKSKSGSTLLYNDYNLDEAYFNLIKGLKKDKAAPDVLGLEAHMIGSEWDWNKLWSTADRFASLNLPLHFSEITVLSGDRQRPAKGGWVTTPAGEALQADYVEAMYTLLFSHPAVSGIAWWNFVDSDWDNIPSGFLRSDLSEKPVFGRLDHLINTTWRTKVDLTTTPYGSAKFRGFSGKYRVTINSAFGFKTEVVDLVAGKHNQWNITVP